jgi:hypothetical protein
VRGTFFSDALARQTPDLSLRYPDFVTDGDSSAIARHAISAVLGGSVIVGLVIGAAPERAICMAAAR